MGLIEMKKVINKKTKKTIGKSKMSKSKILKKFIEKGHIPYIDRQGNIGVCNKRHCEVI